MKNRLIPRVEKALDKLYELQESGIDLRDEIKTLEDLLFTKVAIRKGFLLLKHEGAWKIIAPVENDVFTYEIKELVKDYLQSKLTNT